MGEIRTWRRKWRIKVEQWESSCGHPIGIQWEGPVYGADRKEGVVKSRI